jgi:hypothetical protein
VLNWSISRNYKDIWNGTKISVTPGMYLTRGRSVQRPLTSGPRGWSASQIPWPTGQVLCWLGRGFVRTCLDEKVKVKAVEKVSGGQTTWPASHHLASYQLNQVGNPSLNLYKYPSTVEIIRHTTFWRFHLQSSLS